MPSGSRKESRKIPKKKGVAKKPKGTVQKIKDSISKRTNKSDPGSRTGSGGQTRANRIDRYVSNANTGKKK